MKKIFLPIVAFAAVALIGCGDDSGTSSSSKTDALPASVDKFFDLDNKYTCSQTVNKCATVVVNGYSELAQCDGSQWNMQTLRNPVKGCENVSTENPSAGTPASGNMVSCLVPGVMGECIEFAAGSAEAEALKSTCESVMMGTLGTGCAK